MMIDLKTIIKNDALERHTASPHGAGSRKTEAFSTPISEEKTSDRSSSTYLYFKGFLDRLAALLLIIVLAPVGILFALLIRIDSPGHPIFTQERIGKNGRKFKAYKFRTMQIGNDDTEYKNYLKQYILHNAPYKINEKGEKIFKLVDDCRITRAGSFLRRTNLDELPQLINIVKGEMSFIGPRPDIPFSVELYNDWHRQRLKVMPGITGLWQVCHRKGLSFNEMVKIDLDYINRMSIGLDIRILLLTIRTILIGDGS
jgi:lipopolysaccharide/colanic/teichoic acid biosynthesis glycosyltransferase